MCYVVYKHTNKLNGKIYIGVTNDVNRRWRNNGLEYESSKHFYSAILKYGWDNFNHEILESDLDRKQAFEREKYYIALYNSTDKTIGYNISSGGDGGLIYQKHPKGMLGKKHTKEFCEKHSRDMLGEKNPFYGKTWGENHPKGMLGKSHDEDTKTRISQTCKDKKINCKSVKVIYPNGDSEVFTKRGDAIAKLNISISLFYKLLNSGKPFEITVSNQSTSELKHLIGLKIEKLDNTEVIK